MGQRIKQARLEKGFSQRQLCGDEITRNMLSQIENGSAKPSMNTLSYLARQLDKPVSYFLEEQVILCPNETVMDKARQAYAAGDFQGALDALAAYSQPDGLFDSERWFLEALSLMGRAEQVLEEGKTVYARSLLQKAEQAGEHTPYFTSDMQRAWILLMYRVCPEQAAELAKALPEDPRELFLRAQALLEQGDYAKSAQILDGMQTKDAQWQCLRGRAAMGAGAYAEAATYFVQAEAAYPVECARWLEQCYRELEDYKMAYFYACKQRQE